MRALKQGNRAVKVGGRAVTTDCAQCCNPPAGQLRFIACPCFAFTSTPCAVPADPCIYLTGDTSLSDQPDVPLKVRYAQVFEVPNPIIRYDGVCYTLNTWPPDFPEGALVLDGLVERVENCVDGCGSVNVGPEYYEAFPCTPCPGVPRFFVCASASLGLSIIYAPGEQENVGLCIDRSIGYTLAEVDTIAAAPLANVRIINDPRPLYKWETAIGYPRRVPVDSCCYSGTFYGCGSGCGSECRQGKDWQRFPGPNNWFALDTCCGKADGLRYFVDFAWSKTDTYPDGLVIRETASVTDTIGLECGGSRVVFNIHRETTEPGSVPTDSPLTIDLQPFCCLPYSGIVPQTTRLVDDPSVGDPVPNEPGAYYAKVFPQVEGGTPAQNRRAGWSLSPFGVAFQLAYVDDDTTYSSTGGEFGNCGQWNFQHNESAVSSTDRRTDVSLNLTVRVVPANDSPCNDIGSCTSNGWTLPGSILGFLP